jgi:hypothetical protein
MRRAWRLTSLRTRLKQQTWWERQISACAEAAGRRMTIVMVEFFRFIACATASIRDINMMEIIPQYCTDKFAVLRTPHRMEPTTKMLNVTASA